MAKKASNAYNARGLYWERVRPKISGGGKRAQDMGATFENYRKIFISRFKWGNVKCPFGFIENIIFTDGACYFHNSKDYGGIFCQGQVSDFNIYGQPNTFALSTPMGETFNGTLEDTVAIFDTPLFYNNAAGETYFQPLLSAARYAEIVGDMLGTAETYAKGLKKPTIMAANEKTVTAQKIVADKILSDEPYIFIDLKEGALDETKPLFHNTPHRAEDLNGILTARKTIFSEGLQRLGVRGTLLEKAAYQSDTENEREDLSAELVLALSLATRLDAVEAINGQFGQNITCELNEILKEPPPEEEDAEGDKETEE